MLFPRSSLTAVLALLIGLAFPAVAGAFERGSSSKPSISVSELPPEGRHTLSLIRQGGPFPYPAKDGSTFSNRELRLPKQPRGFYKEYTVKTPGSRDRGARRIICGGKSQQDCYYTGDHYATFKSITE
jgi:ribonuclease T1